MQTLTIDRSKWHRGTSLSVLWLPKIQKGCIMGHALHQLGGVPFEALAGKVTTNSFPGCLDIEATVLAMTINDDRSLTQEQCEGQLYALFAQKGIRLEFVNELVPV